MSARRLSVVLLLVVAFVAAGCSSDKAGRKDGAIDKAGDVSVFDVQVGDCLNPGSELGISIVNIKAVPCSDPHTHEVYALPDFPEKDGDVYPGEEKIRTFANAQCLEAFGNYTGTDYLDSKLFFSYLQPSIKSWQEGDDRRIVCVIVSTGKEVTGSAKSPDATTTTEPSEEAKGGKDQGSRAERVARSKAKAAAREKAREKLGLNH
jgi:hypothetical protein